jgi:hypothetical protein
MKNGLTRIVRLSIYDALFSCQPIRTGITTRIAIAAQSILIALPSAQFNQLNI